MRRKVRMISAVWTLFAVFMLVNPAAGQHERGHGVVTGTIRDADTGEPVGWAQILLVEAGRSTEADETGSFVLRNLPEGLYTMNVYRIGYNPFETRIEIRPGETIEIGIELTISPLESGEIIVEESSDVGSLTEPVLAVDGQYLRQNLGTTIAETIDGEPGVAMRSMGPAPARPVLRGLGGDRLLVLEDGGRTGDLSATSSDHAVVIEPLTAQRIEVIRGPAALVYGSNTLGGVVNVVRQYVPEYRPERSHFDFSFQGESVNRGYTAGLSATTPAGPFAITVDGSIRKAQDLKTPVGKLQNTPIETYNVSAGASVFGDHARGGLAAAYYQSEYGIPGGFVGAHPSGVTVRLNRVYIGAKGDYLLHDMPFRRIEARGDFSRYFHQEFEARGTLGVEFGILTQHLTLTAHTRPMGPLTKGAVGLWGEYRNFRAGGLYFSPATQEGTIAGFAFQEARLGRAGIQAGARYDVRSVIPERSRESDRIGLIRRRAFGGISVSLAGHYHVRTNTTVGLALMRSLRMPGLEELFSEGPHLAAYSFEIGNPELDEEKGTGVEWSVKYAGRRGRGSIALFRNFVRGYIFPRNTGEVNFRTELPIYQYSGLDALMWGGEASAEWKLIEGLAAKGSVSFVRGTLVDLGQPLPWIPPLFGKAGLHLQKRPFGFAVSVRAAAKQDRLGEFETPTDGYTLLDVAAQYRFSAGNMLATVDLAVENVTDTEYRDHLSRVKVVMPEPGRNIKLLYKLYF